jgi:hypothetical protein
VIPNTQLQSDNVDRVTDQATRFKTSTKADPVTAVPLKILVEDE